MYAFVWNSAFEVIVCIVERARHSLQRIYARTRMRLDVSGEKLSGPRFWACEISEKSPVCVKLKNCELNITQCALASISKSEVAYKATKLGAAVRNRVNSYKAEDGNQHYFILCSLREGESMKLDATFFPDDKSVRFRAIGPNILHLSGVISPHKITVGSDRAVSVRRLSWRI